MKHVIWRPFINFEKEEKWLNDMAAKGMNFIHYTIGRYLFEEGVPGEYIYRIELLKEYPAHPESKAYIKFMEESGVECVSTYLRWVYFRKKASEGPFDVYSDYESRIKHYQRVAALAGILGGVNLLTGVTNLFIGMDKQTNHSVTNANLYISLVNLTIVVLIVPMLVSFLRKIFKMKKEKQLYQ